MVNGKTCMKSPAGVSKGGLATLGQAEFCAPVPKYQMVAY